MSDAGDGSNHDVIVCDARREHLPELLAFVERACSRASLREPVAFDVRLATEEAVINVIDHGYAGMPVGSVTIRLQVDPQQVVVTIEDHGRRFDPARVPAPDLHKPLEQRPIGGLGWHLVNRVMDEVRHEYGTTTGNRLTLVKRLSSSH